MLQQASSGFTKTNALRREVLRKFRQVGFWGTITHGVSKVIRTAQHAAFPSAAQVDPFDAVHGTDTGGVVGVGSLDIPEDQMEHSIGYGAISEEEFDRLMKELPFFPNDLVFIDLGSGKGRALLLASRYPFKQIIGVEFSRMLHDTASRNIEIFRNDKQQCRDIKSIWGDASTFDIPKAPLVIFLHNPFDDKVMRAVLAHLERSLKESPRKIYVWYIKPECRQVFDGASSLKLLKDTGRYVFYESR